MILDEICAHKRAEVAERRRSVPLARLQEQAQAAGPARDFAAALAGPRMALIAEYKRASPSRGALNAQADPGHIAALYAGNGAAAISVLTDERFFNGHARDLEAVRAAVTVPVLRKDFVLDEYQIYEARALQADAILLIVRILPDAQLRDYAALARALGMQVLVEIHDEPDLARALDAGAHIIGVNNRQLADFSVDLATTERLAPLVPADRVVVAESGVFTRADVVRAGRAGAHAVLVGEALMRALDVAAQVAELASVARKDSAV